MRTINHSANLLAAAVCALLVSGCPRRAETRPREVVQPTELVGSSAPFFVLATAPDGRWVVACQAREDTDGSGAVDTRVREDGTFTGDDLTPYLFFSGPAATPEGEPLVALLASSNDGRWLAVQGPEAVWLLDTRRGERTRLENALPGASFDRLGQRLAYVRSLADQLVDRKVVAIRDLESGEELLIEPGAGGELVAVRLDPDGEMLNLFLNLPPPKPPKPPRTSGSSGRGRGRGIREPPPLPPPPPPPPRPVCPSPAERTRTPEVERTAAIHRVMLLPDGKPIEVRGLVRTIGRAILRRGERGDLLVQDAQGFEVEWVPHDCGARLLQVDPVRELVLVACDGAAADRPWSEVELHGTRVHRPLGVEVPRGGADAWLSRRPRLFDIPKRKDPMGKQEHRLQPGWVDLDRKTALPWEGHLLWTEGGRAFVRAERGGLWLVDVDLETSSPVTAPRPGQSPLVAVSPFAALDGVVVDVRNQEVVGEYPGLALGLDRSGRVLTSTDPRGWGPARWIAPARPKR